MELKSSMFSTNFEEYVQDQFALQEAEEEEAMEITMHKSKGS